MQHAIIMRKSFVLLLLIASASCFSQPIRMNFMAGVANYNGELQAKKFTFNQARSVFGMGVTFDITNQLLLRGEYNFAKLGADDKFGQYPTRNLNFKTFIQEFDLIAEYNFRDLYDRKVTPYVFGGVGVFKFSPYTTDALYGKVYLSSLGTEGQGLPQYPDRTLYKTTQFNVPMGGGLKYALSNDVQVGVEYGLRILFTDYLDDVSTTYADQNILRNARGPVAVALAFRGDELKPNPRQYPNAGAIRGSAKAKDMYYYALARISIRLNWQEASGGRGIGCPRNVR